MRASEENADVLPEPGAHGRCGFGELLLVLLLTALLWVGYLSRTDFHVAPREDVLETLVAAREFAAGHGFTIPTACPSMLVFLKEQGRLDRPWPNVLRSPLPVVLIGGLLRVTSEPTAIALSSGIFFLLTAPLIYLIAFRLQGRPAAVFATTAFVLSPAGLYLGSTGLTESSTIFCLAAITVLLMRRITWQSALAAGAAAGIGYLGRSTMEMWAVVIVAYVLLASREAGWGRALGRAAAFCVPLAIALVWWGLQMQALTGEFGYSAQTDIMIRHDLDLYPGRSSSLALEHWSPLEFIVQHPVEIARKYAIIAEDVWPNALDIGALPLLMAAFFVELIVVVAGGRPGGFRWMIYGLLVLTLLLVPLSSIAHGGVGVSRYLDPLGPVCAAIGAAFVVELLRRKRASMRLAAVPLGLIVLFTAMPTLMDVAVGPYHQDARAQVREIADALLAAAGPDDVIASTHASTLSAATGMDTVRLPMTPEEFLRLDRELVRVDWMHIRHRGEGNEERTMAWRPIMEGEETLPGFEPWRRFGDGSVVLRRVQTAGRHSG